MLTYSEACVRGYGWWERQQTADKQSRDLIARVDASWWRHKRDFSVPLLLFDMSDGLYFSWVSALKTKIFIRGGADKSLARPTSRCRRMESIVSLERGVCSCAELLVFSCYRGWKEACQATRTISITSRRELSSTIFVLQGKASKEIHDILTNYEKMHHRMPPSKTGWPSLNVWFFHLWCASSWTTQNSDHPGDYWSNSRATLGRQPDFG